MSVAPALLRRPAPDLLDRVCEAITPGSHPERVRRLPGGIAGGTHAFDLVEPSGIRRALVLRRYGDWVVNRDIGVPERAWRTLQALAAAGMPAPRPVWFDRAGTLFDTPAYVMTRVPGRGDICPRDERVWVRQLAIALAALHRTNTTHMDLSFLPSLAERVERRLSDRSLERASAHLDAEVVFARLRELHPCLLTEPRVFSHGDYWPGNALFRRGKLTAVIDWDDAVLAPRGLDVAYCRLDLTLMTGSRAPEEFLRFYEEAAGVQVEQLPLWELYNTLGALPDPLHWVAGYHDFGRMDVTVDLARERLRAFIAGALARLDG